VLGACDLGLDRGEPLLELGPSLLRFGGRLGKRIDDELLVVVDGGELVEDGFVDFVAGEAFAGAGFRSVLLAGGAGVVVVAASVAVHRHAYVCLAALAAAEQAGEEEVLGRTQVRPGGPASAVLLTPEKSQATGQDLQSPSKRRPVVGLGRSRVGVASVTRSADRPRVQVAGSSGGQRDSDHAGILRA
jgi:hypothetical protein